MLQELHRDHPSAVIMVTGYYPIFTAGSAVAATLHAKIVSKLGLPATTLTALASINWVARWPTSMTSLIRYSRRCCVS